MTRVPFAFVPPPGGWGSMTDAGLAEWVRAQITSAFAEMDARPDEQDEVLAGEAP